MVYDMLSYEKDLFNKGIKLIAGVDEVGRGPLAGPLVVGAVILNLDKIFSIDKEKSWFEKDNLYSHIRDSKLVTEKRRCILDEFIRMEAIDYSIVEFSHIEIDTKGIGKVNQIAFHESIKKLKIKPDHILTDAFEIKEIVKDKQTNIKRGDRLSLVVAAASIIAKVYRDNLMIEYAKEYPNYGFDQHKGYGTKQHIDNIFKYGICDIHRKSFEPIKSYLGKGGQR